ncbi:MAG TPA: CapA family protein [Solirubrobacterales bacterium]|nr:CapA family protein [Solirubrobacterales bacterium]
MRLSIRPPLSLSLALLLCGLAATPAGASASSPVTIAAVGDTILGNTPQLPSRPALYLRPISPQLRADAVFGNLEGTLTDASSSPKCGAGSSDCFAFRNPPRFARVLRGTGFTVMNDANNHFGDFGAAGEADTVRALHRAGIAQTGRPGEIAVRRVKGTTVAFLGFAPYANTASLTDLPAARRLIRRADRRAAIVVCMMHAGAEGAGETHVSGHEEHYLGEDRGNPERFARMAIRAGADLVLGSGPHVLRGMQLYRSRLIAYSLGNFANFHNFGGGGVLSLSAVLHVSLDPRGRLLAGHVTSVRLAGPGRPLVDQSHAAAHLIGRLSRQDFGQAAVRLGGRGRFLLPGRR